MSMAMQAWQPPPSPTGMLSPVNSMMSPMGGAPGSSTISPYGDMMGSQQSMMAGTPTSAMSMRRMPTMRDSFRKLRGRGAEMDAMQIFMLFFSIFFFVWSMMVSVLLIMNANQYLFSTISATREWYVIEGCITWAQVEAAQVLGSAFGTYEALSLAVGAGLLSGSTDYAALERVLAPALSMSPRVRGVELNFQDGPAVVSVQRGQGVGDGLLEMDMQSNNIADCFLLGMAGCIDVGVSSGERPGWWYSGVGINTSSTGDRVAWDQEPELVNRDMGNITTVINVWYPSYRLAFRSVPGDTGNFAVGRVTVEVGALSGRRLQDERLGPTGKVYLVDRQGYIIASESSADLLVVERPSGRVRFRYIWELGSAGWASSLQGAFGSGAGNKQVVTDDGMLVALSWMPEPLGHFGIVVAVDGSDTFAISLLRSTHIGCLVEGILPYAVMLAALCIMIAVNNLTPLPEDDPNASSVNRAFRLAQRRGTLMFGTLGETIQTLRPSGDLTSSLTRVSNLRGSFARRGKSMSHVSQRLDEMGVLDDD
mmetsp:Transcript_16259/g.48870  ORF Transcript_16259/g.48870 Transcript_16259/m.48870 type:complete len:537 (-) Transcript_16259:114-1724(-)